MITEHCITCWTKKKAQNFINADTAALPKWTFSKCLDRNYCVWRFAFCFFFSFSFSHVCSFYRQILLFTYYSNTDYALFMEPTATLFRKKKKILKLGPTVLFIHLKIILLQYFQFSVSAKISCIQMKSNGWNIKKNQLVDILALVVFLVLNFVFPIFLSLNGRFFRKKKKKRKFLFLHHVYCLFHS